MINNGIWYEKYKRIVFPNGIVVQDTQDGLWKIMPKKQAVAKGLIDTEEISEVGRSLTEDDIVKFINHHTKK